MSFEQFDVQTFNHNNNNDLYYYHFESGKCNRARYNRLELGLRYVVKNFPL